MIYKRLYSITLLLMMVLATFAQAVTYRVFSHKGGNNAEKILERKTNTSDNWKGYIENDEAVYVEFEASNPVAISGYTLTTTFNGGIIIGSYTNYNPKNWILKAKASLADDWKVVSMNDNESLPLTNYTAKNYDIVKDAKYQMYKFFRFEFDDSENSSKGYELGRLELNISKVDTPYVTFTATASDTEGFDNEKYTNAVNGFYTDKWCGAVSQDGVHLEFEASKPINVAGYNIYTGNDVNNSGNNRNPKSWRLYGRLNDYEDYVLISKESNNKQLPDESYKSCRYDIQDGYKDFFYKQFRLEFDEVVQGDVFEIGDVEIRVRNVMGEKKYLNVQTAQDEDRYYSFVVNPELKIEWDVNPNYTTMKIKDGDETPFSANIIPERVTWDDYNAAVERINGKVNLIDGMNFRDRILDLAKDESLIHKIKFQKSAYMPKDGKSATLDTEGKVVAQYNGGTHIVTIYVDGDELVFNPSCRKMFMFYNVDEIDWGGMKINTKQVTNTSDMFKNCNNLRSIDLSSFDTSKVTRMDGMFLDCYSLTSLDLSSFDTKLVMEMQNMFRHCYKLAHLDIRNFIVSQMPATAEPGFSRLFFIFMETGRDIDGYCKVYCNAETAKILTERDMLDTKVELVVVDEQASAKRKVDILRPTSLRLTFRDDDSAPVEREHYMATSTIGHSLADQTIVLTVNGRSVSYRMDDIKEMTFVTTVPSVNLNTIENPAHEGSYYASFYSSLEAYTLPEGVTAYMAEVIDGNATLTAIEGNILPRGEAVLLHSTSDNINMEVSDEVGTKSSNNWLFGVDVTVPSSDGPNYMLSASQNNLVFSIVYRDMMFVANNAYLKVKGSDTRVIPVALPDDEGNDPTSIVLHPSSLAPHAYTLMGTKAGKDYRGIVIKDGRKYVRK